MGQGCGAGLWGRSLSLWLLLWVNTAEKVLACKTLPWALSSPRRAECPKGYLGGNAMKCLGNLGINVPFSKVTYAIVGKLINLQMMVWFVTSAESQGEQGTYSCASFCKCSCRRMRI